MTNVTISINVSTGKLTKEELIGLIEQSVDEDGISSSTQVEITKSSLRHEVVTRKSMGALGYPRWNAHAPYVTTGGGEVVKSPSKAVYDTESNSLYIDDNKLYVDVPEDGDDIAFEEGEEDIAFEDDPDVNVVSGDL